ncbi:MAG: imidazoleglycerol-phosphate dehydratase HisB [Clostridiales bacterium]|nr:imidazoleglycerol-phosphate dehydratase HisB [Clostridiales bacterium]
MRSARVARDTAETRIELELAIDGAGQRRVDTGCGFLNHMLELLAFHARFDLSVACRGDIQVDDHHTVEDVGIALGQAIAQALGDKRGIARYGWCALPMDEALVLCAIDLSGRSALGYRLAIPAQKIGAFDAELVKEFFWALSRSLGGAIHLQQMAGENSHHIAEAAFKGLGRALRMACAVDGAQTDVPSSKGVL